VHYARVYEVKREPRLGIYALLPAMRIQSLGGEEKMVLLDGLAGGREFEKICQFYLINLAARTHSACKTLKRRVKIFVFP
jgi:hypothetical protein